MVGSLDPHSSYLPPRDYKQLQEDTEGRFAGIGVEVELRDDAIVILAAIEGSPAERAGLHGGDRIVAVGGETIRELGYEKLVRKMRGAPGTHVKLTVMRKGKLEPLMLDLVRAEVQTTSVRGRMFPGGVAYVQIRQFQDKTHEELEKTVAQIRASSSAPFTGVLLDLRNNPGGLVDQATAVADEFLTSGVIYTMRHRGQIVETASAHGGGAFADVPVVVLMNEWSASAAELLAGALQDSAHATVVGTPSFGKGVVQSILDLPGGAGLKLTVSRYYTPSGHGVQGDGIHPDVLVKPSKEVDGGAQTFRESDYANSLPSEGPVGHDTHVVVTYDLPDGGTPDSVIAHEMPTDPRTANDPVMRIGYQVLLRKMKATK